MISYRMKLPSIASLIALGDPSLRFINVSTKLENTPVVSSTLFRYVKCRRLGSGSSSIVYEAAIGAVNNQTNDSGCHSRIRHVALKCSILSANQFTTMESEVERIKQLAAFPWNLELIDHFVDDGIECAAFELGGPPITVAITREVGVPERLSIALRMVDIVEKLHGQGFTHGDLHAGNWLIQSPVHPDSLRLIDFGSRSDPINPDNELDDYANLLKCISQSVLLVDEDGRPRQYYAKYLNDTSPGLPFAGKTRLRIHEYATLLANV